jgi:hypothetical protein
VASLLLAGTSLECGLCRRGDTRGSSAIPKLPGTARGLELRSPPQDLQPFRCGRSPIAVWCEQNGPAQIGPAVPARIGRHSTTTSDPASANAASRATNTDAGIRAGRSKPEFTTA